MKWPPAPRSSPSPSEPRFRTAIPYRYGLSVSRADRILAAVTTETLTHRTLIERFARSHDPQCLAEDAVLEVVPTAMTVRGRPDIARFLRSLAYQDFADARLDTRTFALDERSSLGVIEWSFTGRQIRPAFGMAALGNELALPLCVVCEVGSQSITHARLYFDAATVRRRLAPGGGTQ